MNKIRSKKNEKLLELIEDRYEFGNFDMHMVYAIESNSAKCYDEDIHKVFILVESGFYDEGFTLLLSDEISVNNKVKIFILLFKSKNFIDLSADDDMPNVGGKVIKNAKYIALLDLVKSNVVEYVSTKRNISKEETIEIVDEHIGWVTSGKKIEHSKKEKFKDLGFK